MRRRPLAAPLAAPQAAQATTHDTGDKVFRVSGNGESQTVQAAKMKVEDNGLTFTDAQGNLVGVFRGYGLSAVVEEKATAAQRDPCETVKAMDFI